MSFNVRDLVLFTLGVVLGTLAETVNRKLPRFAKIEWDMLLRRLRERERDAAPPR